MEEIRGNVAELDKQTGFVLSGVRNEGKRNWHRVVDGHRPDHRVSWQTSFCLLASSLARSVARLRGNRQSASPRPALALLTSAAGSMG